MRRALGPPARQNPGMGDIGPVRREITFEPLPDDVPVDVPEPEKVPA